MKLPKYPLKADGDEMVFQFVSKGPRGDIEKLIIFQETSVEQVYNLSFGDVLAEGLLLDDYAISDNGDRDKVLSTVVDALYRFLDRYPDASVYATGSSDLRTRIYNRGIVRYWYEANLHFNIFGETKEGFVPFEKDIEYLGFLVTRKQSNLRYHENV